MKSICSTRGAVIGFFTGGAIGVLASFMPVFHWEMAGLFVICLSSIAGMVAGGLAAARGVLVGGLAGAVSLGGLFALVAATGSLPPDNPSAIPIWGTGTVVVAAFAAAVGSALCSQAKQSADENQET